MKLPVQADARACAAPPGEGQALSSADRPRKGGITARAVLLGLLLIPANALWLAQIEYVRYSDNATTSALFFNCIAVLLILVGLNAVVTRVAPGWAFARGEVLTVYVMLVVASALGGHDQLQILFTTITWVFRNATPENRWAEDLFPHLLGHLLISDEWALERLYLGGSSLYAPGILQAWLVPLGWWTAFVLALVWTLLCLMSVFRPQWDRERLNYPIAGVPLEVTDAGSGLLSSRLFWAAFALAATVQLLRFAHNIWPGVPTLNIGVYNYTFRGMPLGAMGAVPLSSYPFSYGMAYLLPLQLAFSVWFFFWFARLELVVTAMAGHTQFRRFPYIQQQGVGAYLGTALFVLWAARAHLGNVWRAAAGGAPAVAGQARAEALPPPVAVWGFLGGAGALVAFSVAAGMSAVTAVAFFTLFLTTALTLARIRAELGLPTIELYQVGADDMLQNMAGTAAWTPGDLTVMSLYFWLHRTHRQLPMPIHADALRIGEQADLRLPGMTGVILLASAAGIICAFWALLHVMYQTGYESARFTGPAGWAFGNDPWRKLASWLANPRTPDYGATAAYLFGLAFTLLLASLRARFVWWPFHPVGYLVSGSFGLFRMWLPIFLTWLIKSLLLRYGGLSAYQKARPFFLGLILGEFSAAFLRTLADLAFTLYLPPASGVGGL